MFKLNNNTTKDVTNSCDNHITLNNTDNSITLNNTDPVMDKIRYNSQRIQHSLDAIRANINRAHSMMAYTSNMEDRTSIHSSINCNTSPQSFRRNDINRFDTQYVLSNDKLPQYMNEIIEMDNNSQYVIQRENNHIQPLKTNRINYNNDKINDNINYNNEYKSAPIPENQRISVSKYCIK
eukprot:10410_1